MNFTREPIIETVITPREGCKLVVRNSKGNGQEDYYVDAVEVVSFGHSFFFRSSERPKSFLVPVSDYEVLELRETRMVLKNVSSDRSLKIGGGRDAPLRAQRETHGEERQERAVQADSEEAVPADASQAPLADSRSQDHRKRDRRRRGRRGGRDRDLRAPQSPTEGQHNQEEGAEQNEETSASPQEEVKAPSFISKLFPPPPTLIKETLGRYKLAEPVEEKPLLEAPEQTDEGPQEHPKKENEDSSTDESEE